LNKIEIAEQTSLPEGARLVITVLLPDEDKDFWLRASEPSLVAIWNHPQDDAYAQLLAE
jgi:hypothetical protein